MRIGIVTGEYPPMEGGVGAYSAILAERLTQQGHQVYVLSSTAAHASHPKITVDASIHRWSPGALQMIRQWARTNHLDVISLQFQTAAYQMSPYVHFLPETVHPIPLVTTFHDLRVPYLFPKAGKLRNWIVMRLARASDGVITTNHEDLEQVTHLPCTAMIPIGSNILPILPDTFDREAHRERLGISAGEFVIGFFGLINRSKGVETLLETAAILRADAVPVRVLFIGGTAGSSDPTNLSYIAEINSRIDRLDLENIVIRTGYIDEVQVAAALRSVDGIAFPFRDGVSYRRGSLMAALQYGCAIITTPPVVPNPDLVDGENMLFHPVEDARGLAAHCRRLYHDADLQAKLSAGALVLARRFEWDTIARETAAFLQKAAGVSV